MTNANEVVVRYLAAWNEPEPKRRRELVAVAWTDDGTYVDSAREGKGHDRLAAMVSTGQGPFPPPVPRVAWGEPPKPEAPSRKFGISLMTPAEM